MAVMNGFTHVSDLKAYKTTWKIRVRIVHTWKQYTTYAGETIEMILADFKGSLIHATIKKQQFNKHQRLIVFGDWRIIENFQLSRSTGMFRATKHQYKMTIMNSTIISRCDSVSNDFYLDLASFDNILAEDGLNENILIDVVGQVVSCGEMKTSELNDKPKKRLEVILRDTRNIDPRGGLMNGTRLQITQLAEFVLEVIVITGDRVGDKVLIPRILLTPSDTKLPFKIRRRQLPLVVAFAMTINKSQGQSLDYVGLYLPRPCFSHGQFYVAVSRVTNKKGLKILIVDKEGKPQKETMNVVFKEVFQNLK
ncbi:PREDICTED: ATP-dependent DNA helicase PIF1-like [Camelina sativa]|uniref:ATP-dependent DNA helicase PIF1-like n=1 Tax=Camelina sativa TaxID=90675 RepID=A0ABM0UTF1_CAMSA|nr:PREDICTED: ATP-dependent DNA helicase PIF1-like [Camelina sativa]